MRYDKVDPEKFINQQTHEPKFGRGCWTRTLGAGYDYRYMVPPSGQPRLGTTCEQSLAAWAVGAAVAAIQDRLVVLGHLKEGSYPDGVYGGKTKNAVIKFQKKNRDPNGKQPLSTDGTVGRSDARALFTPLVDDIEKKYGIPHRYLLGETNHESQMDPGAVGGIIWYGEAMEYRGVDRAMSQINSKANAQVSWLQAFDPVYSLDWSGKRMRDYHDRYEKDFPKQSQDVLWDAAICAHNNPSAAGTWAKIGIAPTATSAKYVMDVKAAIY